MSKELIRFGLAVAATTTLACGTTDATGPAVAASISISPAIDTLSSIGRTKKFSVTAADSRGNSVAVPTLQWASSDATRVSVDQTGTVTAVLDGDATVSASFGTVAIATTAVKVRATIALRAWISSLVNPSLDPKTDSAASTVVVTDHKG